MPKKANKSGSIRKRPDGRWEGRYVAGYDPGTGKLIRRSIYGATQKEVRQKLTAVTASLDDGTYTAPNKINVGQWLDIWLAEYTRDLKPLTITSYKSTIERKLKPNLSAIKLSDLTSLMIKKLYNKLGSGPKPLSSKTIRNVHGVLHAALQEAVHAGYIRVNPAAAVRPPKVQKAKLSVLEDADIAAFAQAIQGTRYELLLLIDLFTGLRRGELLGLTWDCIDFERNRIIVNKQLQFERGKNARFYFIAVKTGKTRTITVAPTVMKLFRFQRARQAEWHLKNGPVWVDDGGMYADNRFTEMSSMSLVFTQEDGKHIMPDTVYHAFKKAAKAIGKPDLRFHDLRHSYAVASITAGDDVKIVQHNMGHATAAFTLDVYASAWDSMKQASADRMEQFIHSVGVTSGVTK